MIPVHLRFNDAATGRPAPVRLRVEGPAGEPYPPLGRPFPFAPGRGEDVGGHHWLGKEAWWSVDGSVEVPLPAGVPLRVRATRGPEVTPLDTTVTLKPGQMALRFTLERWADLAAEGWHAGDGRVHFAAPHAAALEAAAEGVAVVQLLACDQPLPSLDGTAYATASNLLAFSGDRPALPDGAPALVSVNTYHDHPVLGSVALWGTHRPVYPLSFGGPHHADDWSLCAWCEQGKRKPGGVAVWARPFRPELAGGHGEALAAAILGKFDAVECDARRGKRPFLPGYYRLLNAGVRLPLVGASGKESNRQVIGSPRTYLFLQPGEPLTIPSWNAAVRAGRTFVTNGPLLRFDVGAEGVASAESLAPFDALEIVAGGEVAASARPVEVGGRWRAEARCGVPPAAWLAARVAGGASPLHPEQAAFAHTSPAWVGEPAPKPEAVAALRAALDAVGEWAGSAARYADPRRERDLRDVLAAAAVRLG